MAQVARDELAEFANVEVRVVSFEDWSAPLGAFALAYAARALHWFSPAYCELLATFFDHSALPPKQLQTLLAGVARVIDEHGGVIDLAHTTGLFLARAKRVQ